MKRRSFIKALIGAAAAVPGLGLLHRLVPAPEDQLVAAFETMRKKMRFVKPAQAEDYSERDDEEPFLIVNGRRIPAREFDPRKL